MPSSGGSGGGGTEMSTNADMDFLDAPARATGAPEAQPRPRRLRRTPALRSMLAETQLSARQLIHPLFVRAGRGVERPVDSMPGHSQRSVDRLAAEIDDVGGLGLP